MIKINLKALIRFTTYPEEMDGRALSGLARSGYITLEEGKSPKLTKGARTLLRAASELGWED